MMSTVEGDDSTRRTFKVVRRPADGLAYAAVLAQKHRLGYASLKERLGS
jgi:DNA mismatch repair protein MutS